MNRTIEFLDDQERVRLTIYQYDVPDLTIWHVYKYTSETKLDRLHECPLTVKLAGTADEFLIKEVITTCARF